MLHRHMELFKQLYYDEIATRDRIWNMIMGYLTVFPLIAAAFVYFVNKIKDFEHQWTQVSSYVSIGLMFIVLCISACYFVRALTGGYQYYFIASPIDIENYSQSLIDYYETGFSEDMVLQGTYENYRDFTDHNAKLNTRRQNCIILAFRWLFAVLAISTLLFIFMTFFSTDKPQDIRIVENHRMEVRK